MKVGYISKTGGALPEDAVYFKDVNNDELDKEDLLADAHNLIEEACEYAWSENDGWEWLKDGHVLTLIIDDKEYGDYEISIDFEPVFCAEEVR